MDLTEKLPPKHRDMGLTRHGFFLLFSYPGCSALPVIPFRIHISHQASMDPPLPEAHTPQDAGPGIPGNADDQCICAYFVGKY